MRKEIALLILLWLSVLSPPSFASFTRVAIHPEAANRYYTSYQSAPYNLSYRGREIKTLRAFNNRIYIGYGQDDGPNKPGQCDPYYISASGAPWCELVLRYYSPNTGLSAPQAYFKSQEMSTLEVLGGSLYILAEDPESGYDYIKCTATICFLDAIDNGKTAHVFSATEMDGALYIAGSTDKTATPNKKSATIWKSTNNGGYWAPSLSLPPVFGTANDFSRFYYIGGPYNGNVYTRAFDWYHGWQYYSKRSNGSNWSNISAINTDGSVRRMRQFSGKLIYLSGKKLYGYDGTSSTQIGQGSINIEDFTISDGWLYVLDSPSSFSRIRRTNNFTYWEDIEVAPNDDAISLEVLGGVVYLGTKTGEIYSTITAPTPKNSAPGTVPPNYLLLLSD